MIKIKIKCFSHVKHALGKDILDINLKEGATLESLENKVRTKADGKLNGVSLRIALNKKYVTGDKVLKDGDEVAFIPPVQGG